MTIRIRPVHPHDLAAAENIFLELRRQTYTWIAPEKFQLADFASQTQGETILVAEDHIHSVADVKATETTNTGCNDAALNSSQLVGFISVQDKAKFIHHLYVDSRQQGRGIGRALLRSLPNWGNAPYQLKCLRLNQQAMTFYRACGFIEVDAGTSEDGEYALLAHYGMNGGASNDAN